MRITCTSLFGMLGFVLTTPAFPYPVTWEFAGEITSVEDDNDLFDGEIILGAPFSGSYTFESLTPDLNPNVAVSGNYEAAILEVGGVIAGIPFVGLTDPPASVINVLSNAPYDEYAAFVTVTLVDQRSIVRFLLRDFSALAFASDALPVSPPSLDLFEEHSFDIVVLEPWNARIEGTITHLVPETGTLILLCAGVIISFVNNHRSS